MNFLYPSLVAAPVLALIGIPILIHLINLLRQRPVKWAAMEFLLQSQRKNHRWIRLKEWLLLALRMAVLATLLFMLAQPVMQDTWTIFLGATETHHIVLLDDSFSMADRNSGTSAFARARGFLQRLVERAGRDPGQHHVWLLRFSRAALDTARHPRRFDLLDEVITAETRAELDAVLDNLQASQTDAGPGPALDEIRRLAAPQEDQQRNLYLVSDFREKDWREAGVLRQKLDDLARGGTAIHLVDCADRPIRNLAIRRLRPRGGTLVAGIELFVDLAVQNFSAGEARDVVVRLEEDGHPRPAAVLDAIGPGETAVRTVRVHFATAGQHTLAATLEDDAVQADNSRFAVLDLADSIPVLLIDGGPAARDAYFVAAALAPGGTVRTGIDPVVQPPSFLRGSDRLDRFAAVYLLNINQLDGAEVDAVEQFVRAGGGAAFFLGENSNVPWFNERLYRDGHGLFPTPLGIPTDLVTDRQSHEPDLAVADHPVFAALADRRNGFINRVRIHRYFGLPADYRPDPKSAARVIARLRNGAPLVVEKPYGEGRVIAFLTKASPEETTVGRWNNWAQGNPSYIVMMLELQAYLARRSGRDASRPVGAALEVAVDRSRFQTLVRFQLPPAAGSEQTDVEARAVGTELIATLPETAVGGIYEAQLRTLKGDWQKRYLACNVVPDEGDLKTFAERDLSARLKGVRYQWHRADQLQDGPQQRAGFNLSDSLLILLLVVLCGEQLLAFFASYHPSRRERR